MLMRLSASPLSELNVSSLTGEVTMRSRNRRPSTEGEQVYDVTGMLVHDTGRVYLTSLPQSSPHLLDIRTLFSMVPPDDEALRNTTYKLATHYLDDRIDYTQEMLDAGTLPPSLTPTGELTQNCTLHWYGQLHPAGPPSLAPELRRIEDEMEHPSGIVRRRLPPLAMDAVAYSGNCALLLHGYTLDGMYAADFWARGRHYAMCIAAILLLQLALVARENERARTPTALARLSSSSMFLMCVYDAHISLLHLVIASSLTNSLRGPMVRAQLRAALTADGGRLSRWHLVCHV